MNCSGYSKGVIKATSVTVHSSMVHAQNKAYSAPIPHTPIGSRPSGQLTELVNLLNGKRVPYEVRGWNYGEYGSVVQPDAGQAVRPGDVGFEREFAVPRLIERKRVDDLADSMKDG